MTEKEKELKIENEKLKKEIKVLKLKNKDLEVEKKNISKKIEDCRRTYIRLTKGK